MCECPFTARLISQVTLHRLECPSDPRSGWKPQTDGLLDLFPFSLAKWTSFAVKFICALSLVVVLVHPRALWESGPPVALPDGRVFYYPVKHYAGLLWYWFIYLFVSIHKPLWEMCSCRGLRSSTLNILQAFVVGLGRGGCLFQSDAHLQIRQQTCPSPHATRLKPLPEEKPHSWALLKRRCGWRSQI